MSQPVTQFERNRDAYAEIDSILSDVKEEFITDDRSEQRRKLLRSVEFALISVQAPLEVAERTYAVVADTTDREEVKDAMSGINYGNNKFDYIMYNRNDVSETDINEVIDMLEAGDVMDAQERTDEIFKGVGIVKAGFAIAMLGFKECMCTDTNVIQSVDFEVNKSYSDIDEYQSICEKILSYYEDLSNELSNFMVQWIIFDAMRENGVARHAEFFHSITDNINLPKQADLSAY